MTHGQLKAGRIKTSLTQVQAARRLGVSQPYLSQLEKGERPITPELARSAATLYRLSATALPILKSVATRVIANPDTLARQLAGLGYPGFAHLRHAKANPAAVLLEALVQEDLEVRLAEALPWVVLTYPDMDWTWLIREVKLRDAQNRLGFVVAMARDLAATRPRFRPALERISSAAKELERARLAREDTLCRESMPPAERAWLATTRSPLARHWNLVTGLTADQLSHVS
jgi:transcriptional regulator with XRE-family HTH domain